MILERIALTVTAAKLSEGSAILVLGEEKMDGETVAYYVEQHLLGHVTLIHRSVDSQKAINAQKGMDTVYKHLRGGTT